MYKRQPSSPGAKRLRGIFFRCCSYHLFLWENKPIITISCVSEEAAQMHIHGLQKLAMVDYPGKLAATVFTGCLLYTSRCV